MKNQEKIFRRDKLKDLALVLISIVFIVGGYSILENSFFEGLIGILFFGLVGCVFLIQLITNVSYLKLNEEGFEERRLLKTKYFKWEDVSGFEIRSFRFNKSIHFYHIDKYGNNNWQSILSSYTIKTKDLLNLMNEYKKISENAQKN